MNELRVAMAELERLLDAETTAIAAGDLRGAAALSGPKAAAIDTLLAAAKRQGKMPSELAAPVDGLRHAVAANAVALERALALQGRVIEAVARAASRAEAAARPCYSPRQRADGPPLAFSVRA
jgi:hypothetical protein